MSVEIERKFLVIDGAWRDLAGPGQRLRQAYLTHESHASIRVRLSDDRAWLTVKSARMGIMRDEFEYEIPIADAEEMLAKLCNGPVIEKTRHLLRHDGVLWEVDVFAGNADGLILAEVEMSTPNEALNLPGWVGQEVTDDPRFRNSAIAQMPSASLPA